MKKIFALFLCGLIMFSFCACGKARTTAIPDLNKLFTTTASITYGKFEAEATVNRLGNGLWDVEFVKPTTLAGVKLSYNGEDITASYMGLSFSIPKDAAPIKGILSMIFNSIDKSAEKVDMPYAEKDGISVYSGTSDQGDYTISVEKSSGNLVGFELPDEKLKVEFTNYSVIK